MCPRRVLTVEEAAKIKLTEKASILLVLHSIVVVPVPPVIKESEVVATLPSIKQPVPGNCPANTSLILTEVKDKPITTPRIKIAQKRNVLIFNIIFVADVFILSQSFRES